MLGDDVQSTSLHSVKLGERRHRRAHPDEGSILKPDAVEYFVHGLLVYWAEYRSGATQKV